MRVLIGRTYLGFGDHVMFTALLKMVNKHRPDIQIDIHANGKVPIHWLRLPFECGVRARLVKDQTGAGYDVNIPHMVYRHWSKFAPGETLQSSMVSEFNRQCGLTGSEAVPCDMTCACVPIETLPEEKIINSLGVTLPSKFIMTVSCGAKTHASQPKEYPYMNQLNQMLATNLPLVQVGNPYGCPSYMTQLPNVSFEQLAYVFRKAEFGVFLENGLAHFAGHLGVRHSVLFHSDLHPSPEQVLYPSGHPVHCKGLLAEDVYLNLCNWHRLPFRSTKVVGIMKDVQR